MLGSNPEDDVEVGFSHGSLTKRINKSVAPLHPSFIFSINVLTVLPELPMLPSRNVARRHQNRVRMHFALVSHPCAVGVSASSLTDAVRVKCILFSYEVCISCWWAVGACYMSRQSLPAAGLPGG
jgi:hypothetical protein